MAKAEDVIRIAVAEIGYHEKATNANLDSKTANSGSNNWNKYARDLDTTNAYQSAKNIGKVAAWCTIFTDWTHWMANNKNLDKAWYETCQPKKGYGAGTLESYRYYKNAGRVGKEPKVGADIFYTNSTGKETGIHHTGIVEKFDANYVYTIEGNVSNSVTRVKTSRKSTKIYGYGYPRYDVEPTGNGFAAAANIDIPIHTMGELSRIVLATGKVTADTLNVRTGPGTKHAQLKSVPSVKKGKVVNICDAVKADDGAKWYFIQVDGKYGFVAAKYIEIIGNGSSSSASTDQGYVDGSQNYNTR